MLFALALAAFAMGFGSCGKGGGASQSAQPAATSHSVPLWLIGNWKPLRLFMGEPVEEFDMILSITQMKMEYSYPDCKVSGRLIMSPDTPMYSANYYRMLMDKVNCPQQWDIPTFVGQEDFGKMWAEPNGTVLYRISDKFWEPIWIYIPVG